MRVLLKYIKISLLSGALLLSGSASFAADLREQADALGFVPHKALYSIRLSSTHSGSQIVNVSGQMFYEWQPSCDAWISNHRFNILYEYADSMPMRIASDFSTYETYDGSALNFTSQRKRDSVLFEELRGQAAIIEEGGRADYTLPEEKHFDLPAGTVFPMGHSILLAENIKKKKKFFTSVLFDGSDEEGPVEVSTFIGPLLAQEAPRLKEAKSAPLSEELLNSPAYKIRMAFFPLEQKESLSDYEMSMIVQENGVIREMEIEYDDFSISQELVALDPAEDACKKKRRLNP